MSDAVLVALIVSIPATLTAFAGLLVSLRNSRKIEDIHVATNSMKDALVAATAKASKAEGRAEGVAEGRNESRA